MKNVVERKQIQILVDAALMRTIREIASQAGVKGYTLMRTIGGGSGDHRWRAEDVTGGAGTKLLYSAITDDRGAERLLADLEPLLDDYDLMVTVTSVQVVRGGRFISG